MGTEHQRKSEYRGPEEVWGWRNGKTVGFMEKKDWKEAPNIKLRRLIYLVICDVVV